jgi:hypothetical protein
MRRLMMSLVFATLVAAIGVVAEGRLQANGDKQKPIILAAMSLEECSAILWLDQLFHDARGNEYTNPCDAKAHGVPVVWVGPAHH